MQADIVIIGGGIWGLSTAYHVAREQSGKSILVLERNWQLADETTRQAAGQIGQLRSDPLMVEAVRYTLELFDGFQRATGHDPHLRRSGSLHLAHCPERMQAFQAQLHSARSLGLDVELANAKTITKLASNIDQSKIVGALHVEGDGYVDARRCALALAAAARDLGVSMRLDSPVTELIARNGRIQAVVTPAERIETSAVAINSGPWTGRLAREAGIALPMFPIRLQQARTVADPDRPSNYPVLRFPDKNCYLRPEAGGYLFGYFDPDPLAVDLGEQPSGFRTEHLQPDSALMDQARRLLSPTVPVLGELPFEEYRQGLVTCTPDGAYVVGPAPGLEGVWLATGCGAMGIAGSGAIGRWLARWILRGDPGADLSRLAPDRFGDRAADQTWVQEASRRICSQYYALSSATYSVGGSG